jgi:hypothetical protein
MHLAPKTEAQLILYALDFDPGIREKGQFYNFHTQYIMELYRGHDY